MDKIAAASNFFFFKFLSVKIVQSLGTNRTVGQAPSTSNDWLFWGCSRPPQFHVEKRSTFCFSFLLLFEISSQRKMV
jgi:hypothetical protein